MILGVIPARKGSKGIPGKNIKLLAGRPLIEYTFEAANAAATLDRVVLSTDIEEAMDLARRFPRVEAPFVRPAELCSDTTSMPAVLSHVVEWLQASAGVVPEAVVLLQPTSPFRTAADIDNGVRQFLVSGADSAIGVAPPICHPGDCVVRRDGIEEFEWVFRPSGAVRRQDYPNVQYITGGFYITRTQLLRQQGKIFDERSVLIRMNALNALDLDTATEWDIADAVLRACLAPD